ncbi:MAG: fumarylacetoacetate hydrolase family protein [Actinobacteria bacterium]|nr:fumarylacetoacetate hydrolase family protein [Actinomycetota bacterium]
MRICSVSVPGDGAPRLCAVGGDGRAYPVGSYRDVAELITDGAAGPLGKAVESAGVASDAIGTWDDLAGGGAGESGVRLEAPIRPAEVWAAGVTYERSRAARMSESTEADVYDRVYAAERPELFFKATGARVVGPNAAVGLRSDSTWQVPEAEIGLVLGSGGEVAGYTLGNDMSSRDVEGANPLYLPQAKIFAGACALGPAVVPAEEVEDPYDIGIELTVRRAGEVAFADATSTGALHVTFEKLIEHLYRDNWVAPGTVLLTGTGIIPPDDFTLKPGDVIEISSRAVGVLTNHCVAAGELQPPPGWARRYAEGSR